MIKILLSLILLNNLFSCTPQVNNKDYVGEWLEVKHQNNEFVIVKCDYDLETLKVSQNSIFEHGVMEDTNYKIFSVRKNEKVDILFTDNNKKSYFKFYWIDKQKGIAKWQIVDGNNLLDKYFVLKAKSKEIKSLKGTSIDCITNSDANNNVNDSLILNNNIVFYVENDNCILLKNKKNKTLLENCFDGTNVRIRNVSKEFIPLTFISGQYLMDIDFYKVSDQWVSKEINYYNSSLKSEIKNTKNIAVSLKDFNFNSIKEKFISKTIHKKTSSFNEIIEKSNLIKLDIYKIADILKDNPVSQKNITMYNDAAYYLIENKNYNEARILLLDVVKFSPDRVVAYLNLGDAEWGFDEKKDAKKSYLTYISLMKMQNKDLNKIPQRVYDRLK